MFSNLTTKKRITQVLIAVLVVALAATGSVFLFGDFVQQASAAEATVNSINDWNAVVGSAAKGTTLDITLGQDIYTGKTNENDASGKLAPIPSDVIVNLNMNYKSIRWENIGTGDKAIIDTFYPFENTYWGMIENNGTLNITGTGVISSYQVRYNNENSSDRNEYGAKSAAIVNNGTLTVGAGITVENYMAQANTSGANYQDMFIYSHAIYNTGTVTTYGTIQSGAFAMGSTDYGTNGYATAYSYGIFGGTVNVNGGNIYSEAKSGYTDTYTGTTGGAKDNHVCNFAVGVYSNNATVLGNTKIETLATSWRDQNGQSNIWGSGHNMSWGVGVMYSGANYPVIGAGVNIGASFQLASNSTVIKFPTLNGKETLFEYTRYSTSAPGTYGRRAYAVAGISADTNDAMYGGQQNEIHPRDGKVFGIGTTGSPASTNYYSELDYRTGQKELASSTNNRTQSSDNENETLTSWLTNGASGSATGGQYVLIYRYYDTTGKNLVSASYKPDTKCNSMAYLNPANGTYQGNETISYKSGGEVTNENFYSFMGTYYRYIDSSNYVGWNISNPKADVATRGTNFDIVTGIPGQANKTTVIFADYQALPTTNIKVAAANKGTDINKYSTGTSFTAEYTGKELVAGQDFNFAVIDMQQNIDINATPSDDYSVVTDFYAISGTDTSKVPVTYQYTTDGSTYYDGLPKDVGKYTIRVTVPSDADPSRPGAGNRNGGTFYITGEIRPATPTIAGDTAKTGTYGAAIAELIDTNSYTVTGKNNDTMTGSWSFGSLAATDCPNAGALSVTLTWTPAGDTAKNYRSADFNVTVTINKRNVKVLLADSTATYGGETPEYKLSYENLAACDEAKTGAWAAGSKYQVYYNSTWQEYNSTMVPGTYDLRISEFAGDTGNNNFDTTAIGKLTINEAPLYYTAVAENRAFEEGNNTVNVTLTYATGAVNGESYNSTITTKGTVTTPDAGENKAVTIDVTTLTIPHPENYEVVISNNPTVNIFKANPDAKYTVGEYDAVYDSTRTLADITLTNTSSVQGTWAWADSSIVPSVDVAAYTAIFTPSNTVNYNTVEVQIPINITKKEVTVTVDPITLSYGDAAPALVLKYAGFTGTDNENNVPTTGTVAASTDYNPGKAVGSYDIKINMTDYEAVNYSFKPVSSTITVEKKEITITAPSGTVTYGDTAPEYHVSDLIYNEDDLYGSETLDSLDTTFVINTNYTGGLAVGEYDVTVTAAAPQNYTFKFVNGKITVNKAVLTVTADNKETTYNASAPAFTYTISGYKFETDRADVTGEPTITTTYHSGDHVNTYPITLTTAGMSATNYTFTAVNGTLTVKKADPVIDGELTSATVVHDHAYSEAVFTDKEVYDASTYAPVAGIFTLDNPANIADFTEMGTDGYIQARGVFTPNDTENYNTVPCDVLLVILSKTVEGAPIIKGSAMVNATLTADVSTMAPSAADSYTYQWYVAGNAIVGATGTTYTITNNDLGKQIYVVVTGISAKGYTGSAQSASTAAVVEAFGQLASADQLDITGTNATYTYDGTSHPATVAVKSQFAGKVSDNITVYYNGSTAEPYKAGTYKVTVDIGTPDVPAGANRNEYYGPVSGLEIGTIKIEKAEISVTFAVSDKIYDGTKRVNDDWNITINGVIEPDDVFIDASAISLAFESAAAGNQKVVATGVKLVGADASNYEIVINDVTATIEQATLTATAIGVNRPYNGSATVDVTFTNITGYASVDSPATVYFAQATATATSPDAGTQGLTNIRYELGGSSAGNYKVEIVNLNNSTVTISKAIPNVTPPTIDNLTYDANRTLGNIVLTNYYVADSNGYWKFDDASAVPTVRKTAYAATYVSTNSNYADVNTTITINLAPAKVTLTADNKTVTYGQAASYTVTAEGFTGTDTLAKMGGTQPTFTCDYYAGQPVKDGGYVIGIQHNLDSNGNYTFEVINGTLTVIPANLYVSATATDRDYNGSTGVEVKFAIVSGRYSGDNANNVDISTYSANGTASSANAGTRTVVYEAPTLTGTKASNYVLVLTPASGILTVTINKIDPVGVVFPTSATIPFGYDLSSVTFTDDAQGDGTFAYENAKSTVPSSLGTHTNYLVVFTPTDSVNYNTLSKYVNVTVTECTLSYVVGIAGNAQVGQKVTAVITGMPSKANDYIQYQWFRVSDTQTIAINGATSSVYTATESDVGYALMLLTYFDANGPYVFAEGITEEHGGIEGICGQTDSSVKEENLTFWQRLIRWIQSIIEALTGITFIMGG